MTLTPSLIVNHWENTPLAIMAVVEGLDDVAIIQDDAASVSIYVYESRTDVLTGSVLTPAVADVIYDDPQSGNGWSGTPGYNFRYVIPGSYFPQGDKRYRVEIIVEAQDGSGNYPIAIVNVYTQNLKSNS